MPDVIVGLLITSIFLKSAVSVLRDSVRELREPDTASMQVSVVKFDPAEELCTAGICPANTCQCEA